MALNPYFLQGAQSEQRLTQDLINEHLKMFGVEVTYIPRKFVGTDNILNEVESSKFDDNFAIEAYVNTYEGYSGAGDVLTKFGMSLRDEVVLTISKERYEDFIAPFMAGLDDGTDDSIVPLTSRPKEGDLVYFPLGGRLFEVKFVEHEDPFYQLGKNYVYQLKCELFEYEDEIIDTSLDEIDTQIQETGFITTLNLIGSGTTASAVASLSQPTGYIRELFLNNDGSGYTQVPTVAISTSPSGVNASAVAITTSIGGIKSIERIVLTNTGSGYTAPPIITIVGGNGVGAAATCSIETTLKGIKNFTVTGNGVGYGATPSVTITGIGSDALITGSAKAVGEALINADNQVSSIRIINPGIGYTQVPTVTLGDPSLITGVGTYYMNEIVTGQTSGTTARVKSWDLDTKVLKVSNVGIGTTISGFIPGEPLESDESTWYQSVVSTSGTIGYGSTNKIIGINTAGIIIGQDLHPITNVVGAGATVLSIGISTVIMSIDSINNYWSYGIGITFGHIKNTVYQIKSYDGSDIYDEYDTNDEIETEADLIVDFTQSNPFGTY